ncbi:MAG: DUF6893 family small protein [Acidimicrobiales bacterium]
MYRAARFAVLVGAAWVAVTSLPDLARYLEMRSA